MFLQYDREHKLEKFMLQTIEKFYKSRDVDKREEKLCNANYKRNTYI